MNNKLSNYDNKLPGSILTDLDFFLKYIQENDLILSGKKASFPSKSLSDVNKGMAHSLKLIFNRPTLSSYPHISGIFLLSLTLRLIHLVPNKSKSNLVVNKEVYNNWIKLNSTEKYFTLINVWLYYSDEKIVSISSRNYNSDVLTHILDFFKRVGKKLIIDKVDEPLYYHIYPVTIVKLALLEMFGFIEITDSLKSKLNRWQVNKISITEFATEMNKLFLSLIKKSIHESKGSELFIKKLKESFPSFNNFLLPEVKKTNKGAFIFKVSLSKFLWRKIKIKGTNDMGLFANAILEAFNLDNDHLYDFSYTTSNGILIKLYHYAININDFFDDSGCFYADETLVGDLDINIGDNLTFLNDYGSSWYFDIKLETIEDLSNLDHPMVIESFGEDPEEYPNEDEDEDEDEDSEEYIDEDENDFIKIR